MGINHTPGPWIVYGAPGNVWAPFDQANLANAYIADRDRETQSANARLIAEAPAMLEALREARRMLVEDEGYKTYNPRIREFDAILARIDGTPTAQPAGAIGEAGERCASCGAEEGESHGAQCEARAFAAGADARRLDAGALRAVAGDDAAWLEATAGRDGGEG